LSRKRIRGLVQISISILLLALIFRQVQWAEVRAALGRIDLGWLALAWGLFVLGVIVRAARWQTLLNALGVRRPLSELSAWYFVGGFFNVVLPTGFGGDAVRVAEVAQDTQRLDLALNSVVVDRYLGLMVLLGMGLAASVAAPALAPTVVLWVTLVLFLVGLGVAVMLAWPGWEAMAEQRDLAGRAVNLVRLPKLAGAVRPYNAPALVRALLISLIFNFIQIGWNVAIARGLGMHLPLSAFLIFVPLTAVALLLPAFGGLGVRELTYVGLFSTIGVPQAQALALSLGVYGITVATGLLGGLIYLLGGIRRARTGAAGRTPGTTP
jgi:uncharacterized membrane protein YbhN (UPF0104 family)